MNLRSRLKHKPELHAGALNDILFILLLFFLIVSTLANPNIIKVNNPKGKADTRAKQSLVISINAQQEIFLGSQKTSLEKLSQDLAAALQQQSAAPTVVINGDQSAQLGTLVPVMQAIKAAGATPVMAVQPQ